MANNQYTNPYRKEEIEFIIANYASMTNRDIADKLNELYNTNRTEKAISSRAKVLGLYKPKTIRLHSRNIYEYKQLTQDELDYVENNYLRYPIPELVENLNKLYGNNRPRTTIYTLCRRKGYKYPRNYKYYTEEEQEWLRNNINLMTSKELTDKFNELFHHNKRWDAIKAYCNRILGINFNVELTRMATGKKKRLPIGTERIYKKLEGYIKVKVTNKYQNDSKNWKFKHHIIWEEHYGPIPKGYNVIFLDGDSSNLDINNLALCNTKTLLLLNHWDYYGHDPNITKAGIAICETHFELKKFKE